MGCADYRIDCNGDTDGDGNDLMYGVLDKKSVLELFQGALFIFLFLQLDTFARAKRQSRANTALNKFKDTEFYY